MGRHNGHEALAYVPLTDLDPSLADALLDVLGDEGIAAYVAPTQRRPASALVLPRIDRPLDRVYVDAGAVVEAGEILRLHLPMLEGEVLGGLAERPRPAPGGRDDTGSVTVSDEEWAAVMASYAMPTSGFAQVGPDQERTPEAQTDTGEVPAAPETDDPRRRPGRLLRRASPSPQVDDSPLPDWAWERESRRSRHDRGGARGIRRADTGATMNGPRDADESEDPIGRLLGDGVFDDMPSGSSADPRFDEEHFVPPTPPPLPSSDLPNRFGWLGLLGGPLLLLLGAFLDWDLGGWLGLLAVAGFIGGFLTLVLRMRDPDPDTYDPDDGAVV